MKEKALVIGDIHGMYEKLEAMLVHWRPQEEMLIFLGDYVDRGPQNLEVLGKLQDLQLNYPDQVILLRGNHEQMLINYLKEPLKKWRHYERNGGMETIGQLIDMDPVAVKLSEHETTVRQVKRMYPDLLDWLEGLRYYYSFGKHVCVHAGVDLMREDWRLTDLEEFIWIRDKFHFAVNKTGRNFIFGHTPIFNLHDKDEPWIDNGKYGIDGGAVYGKHLMALRIDLENVNEIIIE